VKIWIITIGEPVPSIAYPLERFHRTGQFAMWAASQADVTWWTSAFNHFNKTFIAEADSRIEFCKGLSVRLFRGIGYGNNISVRRLVDQKILAHKISRAMRREKERPDIIVCSVPPVELAAAGLHYGINNGIPVVLDLRDMWPDIFVDHAPRPFRSLARLLLAPTFFQARRVFSSATALIGITDSFVNWGIKKTTRARCGWDKAFSFAYNSVPPAPEHLTVADSYWDSLGVLKNDQIFTVCFFGSINRQFDFATVFKAFNSVAIKDKVRLVVCGAGDNLEYFKGLAAGQNNIVFTGWVDAPKIYSLMRRARLGLDPLLERYDFLATINNKAVEYMSAGLPIISCPQSGELYNLLRDTGSGVSYSAGDARGLGEILAALVSDPERISRMSSAATKCFNERFDSEKLYADMFNHLKLIAAEYPH